MTANLIDPYKKRPITDQVTANSGTTTALPSLEATRFLIRALPGNAAEVYIGAGTGVFGPSNGFPLAAGAEPVYLEGLSNLNELELVTVADGDGIGFLALYDPAANPLV